FFQAEDGIRDPLVTGVQTCALPIYEVHRHWNGFSFTDPTFRTKEGVGVGSTVADFDKAYGQSSFSEEEGCHWIFENKTFIFALESGCVPDRQQKVHKVWVAVLGKNR